MVFHGDHELHELHGFQEHHRIPLELQNYPGLYCLFGPHGLELRETLHITTHPNCNSRDSLMPALVCVSEVHASEKRTKRTRIFVIA